MSMYETSVQFLTSQKRNFEISLMVVFFCDLIYIVYCRRIFYKNVISNPSFNRPTLIHWFLSLKQRRYLKNSNTFVSERSLELSLFPLFFMMASLISLTIFFALLLNIALKLNVLRRVILTNTSCVWKLDCYPCKWTYITNVGK